MGLITGTIVIGDEIQTTGCRGLWGSHRSDTLWLHGTHLSGPLSASNWCLYPFKIGATIHLNNNSHLSIYLLKAEIYFCLVASLSLVSPLRGPLGAQVCHDDQDDVIWLRVHDIRDSHESLVTSSSHIHRNICLPLSNYPPPLWSLALDTCRGVPVTCPVTSSGHDTRILGVKYFPMLQPHHIYQQSIHTNLTLLDNVKITVLGAG